jgi:serine/threonine protein kinase
METTATSIPTKVPKPLGGFYNRRPTRVRTGQDSPHSFSSPHASHPLTPPCSPQFDLLDENRVFIVNNNPYLALQKIGKGGSSKVYKVITPDAAIYALKRVDISKHQPGSVSCFINEIKLLRMFQTSDRIISLKDSEVDAESQTISIVLELGDIDLRSLIEKNRSENEDVDPNFLRLMWQQMLEATQIAHNAKVIHGDLKPANFLFVRGTLKLIDFGIAKSIRNDTTNIERTNQVGTLNYMSPEALKMNEERHKFKVGRAADVWSLGCILYQLVYNRPPFPQTDWLQKIQAIVNERYQIEFPRIPGRADFDDLVDVMRKCLRRDPKQRPRIEELLQHRYLTFGKMDYRGVEEQLLAFVLMIQDSCGDFKFEGEEGEEVLEIIGEQFRNGERIAFPGNGRGEGWQKRKV